MAESNEAVIPEEADEINIPSILWNYILNGENSMDKILQDARNRLKEECEYMVNCNSKLEIKIKHSEQKNIILMKTVKLEKNQAKERFRVAKEKHLNVLELAKKVEVKYDDMWLERMQRFIERPISRQLLQAKKKTEELRNRKANLENAIQTLTIQIKDKKHILQMTSKKNVVQLAEFIIHDFIMPTKINLIKEKSAEYNKLNREIEKIYKQQQICNTKENFAMDNKCTTIVCDDMTMLNSEENLNIKRKLIHTLEVIKHNEIQAYNLVAKVNIQQLRAINTIGARATENETIDKADEPMEDEQIEVIDLTNNTENILLPPTQFMDQSQNDKEQRNHNVSGLLFNNGPEGILDSLNLKTHCVDPNPVWSPKADLAMPASSSNAETNSHEIPSFCKKHE